MISRFIFLMIIFNVGVDASAEVTKAVTSEEARIDCREFEKSSPWTIKVPEGTGYTYPDTPCPARIQRVADQFMKPDDPLNGLFYALQPPEKNVTPTRCRYVHQRQDGVEYKIYCDEDLFKTLYRDTTKQSDPKTVIKGLSR
jgi:hypothetical protein